MPRREQLIPILTMLALLATALPALAQGDGKWQRRGPGAMDGHRLEHLAQRLELTDGQRDELKQAFADRFEAGAELRQTIFQARQALEEQVHAAPFDEQAVRDAARTVSALEAEAAVERARQAQKMREILTPEQLAELEELRSERHEFGRQGDRGLRGRGLRGPRGFRGRGPGGPPPTGS